MARGDTQKDVGEVRYYNCYYDWDIATERVECEHRRNEMIDRELLKRIERAAPFWGLTVVRICGNKGSLSLVFGGARGFVLGVPFDPDWNETDFEHSLRSATGAFICLEAMKVKWDTFVLTMNSGTTISGWRVELLELLSSPLSKVTSERIIREFCEIAELAEGETK